jgi:hypothetical protein
MSLRQWCSRPERSHTRGIRSAINDIIPGLEKVLEATHGPDGRHVDQGLNDQQRSDRPRSADRVLESQSSSDEKADEHASHTSHVQGGATETGHQEPTDDA